MYMMHEDINGLIMEDLVIDYAMVEFDFNSIEFEWLIVRWKLVLVS